MAEKYDSIVNQKDSKCMRNSYTFFYFYATLYEIVKGISMKRGRLITFFSIFLLVIGLFSTLILDDGIAGRIAEIVTVITAVIGAIALFLQFKRDKNINEARFLLEFWKNFSDKPQLIYIQRKCDEDIQSEKTNFTEEDYDGILMYAQWLEALCSVINNGMLSFNFIDDMYNYMFFVFVNNKYVQEKEILPNSKYYQGIIKAYSLWVNYLKKHKKEVMLEQNSLSEALNSYKKTNNK